MYEFLDYQVHDVMTRDPVTVSPETPLAEAEALFEEHQFNGCPVVDAEGCLVGVFTKLDLLRAFRFDDESLFPPYQEIMKQPVRVHMSRDLRSVRPRTPLTKVLERMVDSGVKALPVVDDGRLVAMVAREDVMAGLRRAASGERATGSWQPSLPEDDGDGEAGDGD